MRLAASLPCQCVFTRCVRCEKGGRRRLSLADGQVDAMKPLQFVSLSRQLRPQVRRKAAALSMTRRCDRAKGKSGSVPLHARRHLYS